MMRCTPIICVSALCLVLIVSFVSVEAKSVHVTPSSVENHGGRVRRDMQGIMDVAHNFLKRDDKTGKSHAGTLVETLFKAASEIGAKLFNLGKTN